MPEKLRFALLGNPNSGKTTLFNILTNSKAHVGNWPGVTVEKREGVYSGNPESVLITDLPGVYSLSPYSPEENVTRNFILNEKPDAVIDVVDATNLERNLYLTTQALEIDVPVIVALNMMDALEREGSVLDVERLERAIGVPVVPISALKGQGIENLMTRAVRTSRKKRKGFSVMSSSEFSGIFLTALELYREKKVDNAVFRSVKMLENDPLEKQAFPDVREKLEYIKKSLPENLFDNDFEAIVADARYRYVTENFSPALKKRGNGLNSAQRADKFLTHRIWGIPLFILIMFMIFHLTFSENLFFLGIFIPENSFDNAIFGTDAINSPGKILTNCVNIGSQFIMKSVSGIMPEGSWYRGLICDGVLSGVFAVLSFVPQILLLFLFLSILEDSGYMARICFILDRIFRKFGLSGKAFLPLLTCFGCAVPGIMATRSLENERERRLTVMLAPFFSCGAKLPVWSTFAAVLYNGAHADLVVFSMYLLGIVVAGVSAIILSRTLLKSDGSEFIMELPPYRLPKMRNTLSHLWQKLSHYLERAATVIAGGVVILWVLSHFNFSFAAVEDMSESIIGTLAKAFSWIFAPLGFGQGENGWKFVVAIFSGLIAKEMTIATLGSFAGMTEGGIAGTAIAELIGGMEISAAFAFMAFNLLTIPCMAAVAAARSELGKGKPFWTALGFWVITAFSVSLLIYWSGKFLLTVFILVLTVLIISSRFFKRRKKLWVG